jgi:cytochrome P450
MMIMMDPPRHDRLRKLVSRTFTPRRVGLLETRTRELCAETLDPHLGGDSFDYVEECGARIPGMIIGALMGVPTEDQNDIRIWIDDMMRWDPTNTDPRKAEAGGNIERYLQELVAARRNQPRDDMVSDLLAVAVELDDGSTSKLTHEEIMGFVQLLLFAGNETTARLIGWTALLLARHPDQRAWLVEDPALVPNAIEEILRFEAPSPIQGRLVRREVTMHGTTIPAFSRMALLNGSADRDERHFDEPDRFDIRRTIDRHLAFGYGIHFCIGAALARLEGRVVLEETLARFPNWSTDESGLELVRTSTVRGPAHLPFSA